MAASNNNQESFVLRAMSTAPKDGRYVVLVHYDFSGLDAFCWDHKASRWVGTVPDMQPSQTEDFAGWFEMPEDVRNRVHAFVEYQDE